MARAQIPIFQKSRFHFPLYTVRILYCSYGGNGKVGFCSSRRSQQNFFEKCLKFLLLNLKEGCNSSPLKKLLCEKDAATWTWSWIFNNIKLELERKRIMSFYISVFFMQNSTNKKDPPTNSILFSNGILNPPRLPNSGLKSDL